MHVVRRRVVELLAPLDSAAYRRLWAAQLTSELGDSAARIALAMLVFAKTESAIWTTATVALSFLPWVGPGQLLSTLADRFGRRVVMVSCDLVRAAVFLVIALPLHLPLAALLGLTFVAGLAAPPFGAARSAAVPEVVPADQYGGAIKLANLTDELAVVMGSLLGGGLLALIGPAPTLAVNAGTFVISALLLVGLPHLRPDALDQTTTGSLVRLREAMLVLVRDRALRRAALLANVALGCATAVEVLVFPHSALEFPRLKWLAGAIIAAISVAALTGTALLNTTGGSRELLRRTALLTAVPALSAATLFVLPIRAAPIVGFVAIGGLFIAIVPANTLMGPQLPIAVRATAFSVLMGGLAAVQASLTLVAGLLADLTSPRVAGAIICLLPVAVGAWVLLTPDLPHPHAETDALADLKDDVQPDGVVA